jgi:formylglycine-generating enzyme required for sulfatase activity
VTVAEGFWLFDTPCTQALWQAVMGANPSRLVSPTRPVERVSWDDAWDFIRRINVRVPGLELCLPSEARWEYACRAGTTTATYAGEMLILGENNAPILDAIAWYGGNSGVDFELENGFNSNNWPGRQYDHLRAETHPVALKRPNAWGLYDMLGNVWEWCEDDWHVSYQGAPADGSAWVGIDRSARDRVMRGGAGGSAARRARAASRLGCEPGYEGVLTGFRCAGVETGDEPSLAKRSAGGTSATSSPEQAAG